MVFEGSEKKLEIVFDPESSPFESLRDFPRETWEKLVAASDARILSEVSSVECDAYLLSESSLFVFDFRILMITCGQTALIRAAEKILKTYPAEALKAIFYERKNEAFPQAQKTTFEADCKTLAQYVPGQIHSIGIAGQPGFIQIYQWGRKELQKTESRTIEILMHDLDPKVLFALRDTNRVNRTRWSDLLHFREVFPNYFVDENWFEPCGYSLNAVREDSYFTIHLTPETQASYVSLETNHPFQRGELTTAVQKIVELFKPSWTLVVQFDHKSEETFDLQISNANFITSDPFVQNLEPNVQMTFRVIRYQPTNSIKPTVWTQSL